MIEGTGIQSQENVSEHAIERLNQQRQRFSQSKTTALSSYLERDRKTAPTDRLLILNGAADAYQSGDESMPLHLAHLLLPEQARSLCRCGGYWLQIGGKGIAINPGTWFLERFHRAGFHIWDIDHVIVTDGDNACSAELGQIWEFNHQINTLMKKWELAPHIISYHLHPRAYQEHSRHLRPNFRQEVGSLHRLDTFADTADFESFSLSENVKLEFYPSTSEPLSPLMIRLRLLDQDEEINSVGYLSNTPWDERQTSFLSCCQTVVLGVGKASFEENNPSLGCLGVVNILNSTPHPRLAILAEHDFSEGDTRIEATHYAREELSELPITLLPAEENTLVHLDAFQIKTPDLIRPIAASSVRTTRSQGAFSRLHFLDVHTIA